MCFWLPCIEQVDSTPLLPPWPLQGITEFKYKYCVHIDPKSNKLCNILGWVCPSGLFSSLSRVGGFCAFSESRTLFPPLFLHAPRILSWGDCQPAELTWGCLEEQLLAGLLHSGHSWSPFCMGHLQGWVNSGLQRSHRQASWLLLY